MSEDAQDEAYTAWAHIRKAILDKSLELVPLYSYNTGIPGCYMTGATVPICRYPLGVLYYNIDPTYVSIVNMDVCQYVRRCGIGDALLNQIIKLSKSNGVDMIVTAECTKLSAGIFERRGFVRNGKQLELKVSTGK